MKILMLAPEPFFEPRGTPFSVLGRLRALSHLRHEVHLLTYHVGQDVTIPGVTIFRTPAIPLVREVPVGPSRIKILLDLLLFIKAFRFLQKGHYDLLHTHEEASFFGLLLAKYFRIPHLYDMHSSLPQQLQNFRYSRLRPLIRLFAWLEYRAVTDSNALITICPALEEHVQALNGHVPHAMIENVVSEGDPLGISEAEMHRFKATYDLPEAQKIVLYTGNFEPYQGLDLLIDSAKVLLGKRQDVRFLLVGGKLEQIGHYQRLVQDADLTPYFRFLGTLPSHAMPYFLRLADVLVSPRTSGTNTPLKIYAYLQSAKPIVATHLSTHTQVLTPMVAVLVKPCPEALAQGLLAVLEDPYWAWKLGQQARQLFEKKASFLAFVQKTEQILQKAVR